MSENKFKLVAAVLLCTTILTGALAVQYYTQLTASKAEYELLLEELGETTVTVNFLIDAGDSTTWYNDTRIPIGANLIEATEFITEVDSQDSEWGTFVVSIGGVGGDSDRFWGWSHYDGGWEMGTVGADQWIVHEGDVLRWTYTLIGDY